MSEFELKFQVPPPAVEALRADLHGGPGPAAEVLRLQAVYHDTPDALLGRHRLALRVRREGDRWVQTLKASLPHSLDRLEENVDRGPAIEGIAAPPVDLDVHAGTAAGQRLRGLLDAHPAAVLGPRYATDVRRLRRTVAQGGGRAEIALDVGEIVADGRRAALCEIEFERLDGDPAALFHLASRWAARHGLWLDVVSKAERGERLAAGGGWGPPVHAAAPRIDRGMPLHEVGRRVVAACLDQVLPNASAILHGSPDPEHVHQARVGLRRLRTALRDAGRGLPGLAGEPDAPLAAALRALGARRDEEVLGADMQSVLAAAGAPRAAWDAAPAAALPAPAAVLVEPAFQQALLRLVAIGAGAVALGGEGGPAGPGGAELPSARRALGRRLERLRADIVGQVAGFESLPQDAQHRVRKRLKRLRYLAEFAAPLFDARRARGFLSALGPAQDALGRQHDEAVALARFRATAAHDPTAWFAVGWLTARQPGHAAAARAALAAMTEAPRFWR